MQDCFSKYPTVYNKTDVDLEDKDSEDPLAELTANPATNSKESESTPVAEDKTATTVDKK